jgi:hypothetical protein
VLVAAKAWNVQTDANGLFVLTITDAARTPFVVVAEIEGRAYPCHPGHRELRLMTAELEAKIRDFLEQVVGGEVRDALRAVAGSHLAIVTVMLQMQAEKLLAEMDDG